MCKTAVAVVVTHKLTINSEAFISMAVQDVIVIMADSSCNANDRKGAEPIVGTMLTNSL